MNMETRLSSKGQVVIPKDIRDALRLVPGERLRVSREAGRIIIEQVEPDRQREKISYEEFRRRVPRWEGPPASIQDMNAAVDRMFAERGQP